MVEGKKVVLVIPAHNEEKLIQPTLEAVPSIVDKVIVVDDGSLDTTAQVVEQCLRKDPRILLLQHEKKRGPGAAIVTGYLQAMKEGCSIVVVCGGDFQMPLEQIHDLIDPILKGEADYTKGNRFMLKRGLWEVIPKNMPKIRLLGNMVITLLTKLASGYYKVADVVDGFTAIRREALDRVDWTKAWKGYGYPMEFLIRLNAYGLRVKDVPRRAIYLPGERQSQIKGMRYALKVSPMLIRGFFWRLWVKYVLLDFHPLIFFYFFGLLLLPAGLIFGGWLVWLQFTGYGVSGPKAIFCALLIITGMQFLLFAMLFDMEESCS